MYIPICGHMDIIMCKINHDILYDSYSWPLLYNMLQDAGQSAACPDNIYALVI